MSCLLAAAHRLIRETIYPSLRDHPSVDASTSVRGMAQPLFWVHHTYPEGGAGADEGRSKFNRYEIDYCLGLARWVLQSSWVNGRPCASTLDAGHA